MARYVKRFVSDQKTVRKGLYQELKRRTNLIQEFFFKRRFVFDKTSNPSIFLDQLWVCCSQFFFFFFNNFLVFTLHLDVMHNVLCLLLNFHENRTGKKILVTVWMLEQTKDPEKTIFCSLRVLFNSITTSQNDPIYTQTV